MARRKKRSHWTRLFKSSGRRSKRLAAINSHGFTRIHTDEKSVFIRVHPWLVQSRISLLPDLLRELEDRQEDREHHAAYDDAHDADHDRLDERGQLLDGRAHLLVVELADLLQQRFERARLLADRD